MKKNMIFSYSIAVMMTALTVTSSWANEDKLAQSAAAYEEALDSLNDNALDEATIHLRNAIKYNPDSLPAYIKLAETYLQLDQPAAAEWTLGRLRSKNVDISLYAELMATAYFRQSRYEELLETLPAVGLAIDLQSKITLWRGKAYLGLRNYASAEHAFESALALTPTLAEAHVQLSRLRLLTGQTDAAEQALKTAQSYNMTGAEYLYLWGELYRQRHQFDQAIAFYDKTLQADPDHLMALVTKAGLLLDTGSIGQAESLIAALRKKYPSNLHVAYLHTLMLSNKGDRRGAAAALEKTGKILDSETLTDYQDDPRTLNIAGAVYYFLNRHQDAINALDLYLNIAPHNNEVRRILASAQLKHGMPRDALKTLRDGLYYEDKNLPLMELLGRTFMELGRYEEAAETYEFLSNTVPDNESLQRELALAKFSTGVRGEAIRKLEELSHGKEEGLDSALVLANLYIRNQEFSKAIEYTATLKETYPKVPLLYNISASAHLALGQDEAARADYLKAIALAPRYTPAMFNLASLDHKQGRLAAAKQLLNRVVDIDSNNHMAMIQLSRIAQAEHDLNNAVRWLERALTDYDSIDESLRLANLHLKTNNLTAATTVIDALTAAHEDNLRVLEASALIKTMHGDVNRARSLYRQISSRAVNSPDTLYWLHRIARRQKDIRDIDAARDTLQLALEYDADNLRTHTILAELDIVSHRYQDALAGAENLITQAPDHPVGYSMASDIMMIQNNHQQALTYLQRGLQQRPDAAALALRIYKIVEKKDGLEPALKYLADWETQHRTQNTSVLQALGAAYTRNGEYNKAAKINGFLLTNDPQNPVLLNNLAALYMQTGDPRAEEYAQMAYTRAPDNPAVMDTLGWILIRKGVMDKGLSLLRNAHSRAPADLEIAYHTATALIQTNNRAEAIETLQRSLALTQQLDADNEASRLLTSLLDK